MNELLRQCNLVKVSDVSAAATTALNSASVDMTGYDGAIFFTSFGTAADGNKINAATGATTAAFVDLEGSSASSTAATEDFFISVHKPRKQFLRCEILRPTSSTVENIWCLQYKASKQPVTINSSGTIIGTYLVGASTGTA